MDGTIPDGQPQVGLVQDLEKMAGNGIRMATRALVDSTGTGLAKATDGCHTEAGSLRVIPGFHLPGLFPRFRPASGGLLLIRGTCLTTSLPLLFGRG